VNLRSIIAAAGLAAAAFAAPATAQEVTGAGATFPFPVYAKWAEAYKAQGGATINYQSIGSGGGIRQIRARTVAFGATDAPLKGEDLEKDGLVQFPTVLGGVVPVVNIQGLQTRQLRLTGELVADIYRGEIKTWNDKRIAELNPGVNLPAGNITPVYRSDGSGTTSIFTTYLSEVSPQWKEKLGSGTTVNWPVGQGGKGNEGVAATVKQVNNSIGYVEYAYAKQNNIPYALMRNKDGQFVAPDDKSFAAAARARTGARHRASASRSRTSRVPRRGRSRAPPSSSSIRSRRTRRRSPRRSSSSNGPTGTAISSPSTSTTCRSPTRWSRWSARRPCRRSR
jgi:phosphate transport system substrate-binding protein